MGQVPDDLNEISTVAGEVESLRERTQSLVAELEKRLRARASRARELVDRTRYTIGRVRDVTDVRKQLREHPTLTIGIASAATLALGLGVYFVVARRTERGKPLNRLRARVAGYRALLADPHRALHRHEALGTRLIKAVIVAGAVTITRALTVLLVKQAVQPRRLPPTQAELVQP
jgi:ElaB/YqjD/DUF883 family membrane-anchored ribosome-binding protein